jgi:hypothetical protein
MFPSGIEQTFETELFSSGLSIGGEMSCDFERLELCLPPSESEEREELRDDTKIEESLVSELQSFDKRFAGDDGDEQKFSESLSESTKLMSVLHHRI